ncbi:MAG: hypothetical protein IKU84_06170 [Clostridia bacterium]|nr:hypothetical protein [Clostridia bacterium]
MSKRIFALTLALLLLVSCGGKTDVERHFYGEDGERFLKGLTASFTNNGANFTCKSKLKVVNDGVVVTFLIDGYDAVGDDFKASMQESFDSLREDFEAELAAMRQDVPGITSYTINVCEADGDAIASISVE